MSRIACDMNFKIKGNHTIVQVQIDGPYYFKSFLIFSSKDFEKQADIISDKMFFRQTSSRDRGSLYESNLLLHFTINNRCWDW